MKIIGTGLLVLLYTISYAQDIIIYNDGSEKQAKVLKINAEDIVYKKFENLKGPEYTEAKTNIFMIKYEGGDKDMFDNTQSLRTNQEIENNKNSNNNYIGKEISYFDGVPFISYSEEDAVIAISLRQGRQYGKYYIAEIMIFNNTGSSIDFIPKDFIYPAFINRGIVTTSVIMSYEEYNKKVRNYQAWRAVAVGFANAYSASGAGHSTSYSSGSVHGYGSSTTNANAYGSGGWSAYGTSNTNSSINLYGSSTTNTYDGGKAYAASQNAANNTANFAAYQNIEREQIKYDYLKRHTLRNGEEISGKINIPYQDAEIVEITILLDGEEYIFDFSKDLILKLND
jgi:hypothetical protein